MQADGPAKGKRWWTPPALRREDAVGFKFGRLHGSTVNYPAGMHSGVLLIKVRDTGIGIAAQDMGRILIPFDQRENSGSRSHLGTG